MAQLSGFSNLIELMAGADAFQLLLPFLFSWIVYYIGLTKADFLFEDSQLENLPPVIALIMAFFTARFLVVNPFYQSFFIDFTGKLTIGVIGILGMFTILAFSGYQDKVLQTPALVLLLLSIVGAAFVYSGGFGPALVQNYPSLSIVTSFIDWTFSSGAIWLIVIGGTIWWVTSEPDTEGPTGLERLLSAEALLGESEDE